MTRCPTKMMAVTIAADYLGVLVLLNHGACLVRVQDGHRVDVDLAPIGAQLMVVGA